MPERHPHKTNEIYSLLQKKKLKEQHKPEQKQNSEVK